jgi:hypothetical protein
MIRPLAATRCCSLAVVLVASAAPAADGLSAIWRSVRWGEPNRALVAQFGSRATVLPWPIDFGDSYAVIALRNVSIGGVPVVVFFQIDKRTGGLKRIQVERQRHGANPPALRAILAALVAEYGAPAASCQFGAAPTDGYQAGAEWLWRRSHAAIQAIYRDTTIEAFEGCLGGDVTSGYCGLTGQLLVRISPPGTEPGDCPPTPPAAAVGDKAAR